jgi:LacI family transcriptional regulator
VRRLKQSDVRRSPRPTVQDVAERAGVSTATVSRVLNGADTVDAALVDRVRAACDALHYRPNKAARALAGGRSAIVGMIVTDSQNPFFMDLVRGAEDITQQHGYLLVLCNSKEDRDRERQYIDALAAEAVAGVIVVPSTEQKHALQVLVDNGIPVVSVDRRVRHAEVDAVLGDNVAAAHEAVTHLIANGYRRIGVITGPERITTGRERLEGYRHALRDAGILLNSELERSGPFTEESGRRLAHELLGLRPPIEALLVANNRLAKGALESIHAHNLRVPDDIAVVGFDEMPWMSPGSISLTTITQPAYELGSAAALRLIQRLQSGPCARQEIVLAHHLHVGDSSRARGASAEGSALVTLPTSHNAIRSLQETQQEEEEEQVS